MPGCAPDFILTSYWKTPESCTCPPLLSEAEPVNDVPEPAIAVHPVVGMVTGVGPAPAVITTEVSVPVLHVWPA